MRPAMTGDTVNGRSMKVVRRLLPVKSNLAMHHAAVTPKTVLSTIDATAVISVRRIAASASGSVMAAK